MANLLCRAPIFFRLPVEKCAAIEFARQFATLFIEVTPRERSSWFGSLEEAIIKHGHEFL